MKELLEEGIPIVADEPMSKHTTLGIGGPAEWYAEVDSLSHLDKVLRAARQKNLPVFFLGAGSNLLVSDRGIAGLVIRLHGEFESVRFNGQEVRAGAGTLLPSLIKQAAERGLGGAEPLVGVPGTVGGALVMNAGTRELEIGQIVKSVEVIRSNGELHLIAADQISFQYRSSSLRNEIICFATLQLKPADKDDIIRTIQEFLSRRLQSQPIGTLNVGSIFKNPAGRYAAQLIEQAGLKGTKRGNAQISPKHANFIVNCGGASSEDVKGLIFEIQDAVYKKFGVRLEPEIKIVGR